jgi:hypothetical protein
MLFFLFAFWFVAFVCVLAVLILMKLAIIIAPVVAAGFIIWLVVRLIRRKS